MTEPTIYEAVGGRDGLVALAHAWHRRCLDDPMASHPFSHGSIHPQHAERLAAYFRELTMLMGAHPGSPDDVPSDVPFRHWSWDGSAP